MDSAFTIGAVALASLVRVALGDDFIRHVPFLVWLLAVLSSATRGGLIQGILATFLGLGLEVFVWGEWSWFVPAEGNYHLVEIFFYLLEGSVISLLAAYYLNGRRALHHSQARFQVLFDAMPVGAMIHHQNKIVVANKTLADMFGYSISDLIGKGPVSILAPDDAPRYLATDGEAPIHMTGLRRNGSQFPVEVISKHIDYQGRPMRVMVMRDLTELLTAHQGLEQMTEQLEARVLERTTALVNTVTELRLALENVQTLSGLLPICGSCKRIRDDDGYWSQVEDYISAHSTAQFSHSLCPECLAKLRDEIADRQRRHEDNSQS